MSKLCDIIGPTKATSQRTSDKIVGPDEKIISDAKELSFNIFGLITVARLMFLGINRAKKLV